MDGMDEMERLKTENPSKKDEHSKTENRMNRLKSQKEFINQRGWPTFRQELT